MLISSASFIFEIIENGAQIFSAKDYWEQRGGLWFTIDTDGTILWDEGK